MLRTIPPVSRGVPDPKRAKDGFPVVEYGPSGAILETLHFVTLGSLTPVGVTALKVWALANPSDPVVVWRDHFRFLTGEFIDGLSEFVLEDYLPVDRPGVHENSAYDPNVVEEQISKFRRFIASQIANGKEGVGGANVDRVLLSIIAEKFDKSRQSLTDKRRQQSLITEELKTFGTNNNLNLQVRDVSELLSPDGQDRFVYEQMMDRYFLLQPAESFIQRLTLYKEGGRTFPRTMLPKVNEATFAGLDFGALSPDEQMLLDEARTQLAVEAFLDRKGFHGLYETFRDYHAKGIDNPVAKLAERHQTLVQAMRSRVTNDHPVNDLLLPVPELVAGGAGLWLSEEPEASAVKPLVMASQKGHPALLEMMKDTERTLGWLQQLDTLKKDYPLPKLKKNPELATKRYFELDSILTNAENKYQEKYPLETDHEVNRYRQTLLTMGREGFSRGDALGAGFGQRMARRNIWQYLADNGGLVSFTRELGGNSHTQLARERSLTFLEKQLVNVRGEIRYDNQVIITLGGDSTIFDAALAGFARSPSRSVWFHWNTEKGAFTHELGDRSILDRLGENSRVVVGGHGAPPGENEEGRVGKLNADESTKAIKTVLFSEGASDTLNLDTLVLDSCCLEDNQLTQSQRTPLTRAELERSWTAKTLQRLSGEEGGSVSFKRATARNDLVVTGFLSNRWVKDRRNNEVYYFEHKAGDTRLEFFPNSDGTVSYRAKPEAPVRLPGFTSTPDHVLRPLGSQKDGIATDTLTSYLEPAPLSPGLIKVNERLSGEGGLVLIPADTNALLLAMQPATGNGEIAIADANEHRLAGIQGALMFAGQSSGYEEWLDKLEGSYGIAARQAIQNGMGDDPEAAFGRLQQRRDKLILYNHDPASESGSAIINLDFPDGIGAIHVPNLPSSCSTRKRQTCTEPTEEEINETLSALTLLADENTRILAGDSAVDIALHDASEDPALAKIQEGLHDFRRSMASSTLKNHEGYHTVIVLEDADERALSAARTLVDGDDKGRVLRLDVERQLLLTDDGRVVTLVEGGDRNRLSVVAQPEFLKRLTPEAMATAVKRLTLGEKIGTLSVHPVVAGDGEHAFVDLGLLGEESPWQGVARQVRQQGLDSEGNPVSSFQVAEPGSDRMLELNNLPNEFWEPDPGLPEAGLRDRLSEAIQRALGAETAAQETLTARYAHGVRKLYAQQVAAFSALDELYQKTPHFLQQVERNGQTVWQQPMIGEPRLTPEQIPHFNTLMEVEVNGRKTWSMVFGDRYLSEESIKVVPIEDERIVRYVAALNEHIETARASLGTNLARKTPDFTEGVEAVDFLGSAMLLQAIVELAGHGREKAAAAGGPLPPDYQRALFAHQVVGMLFGGKAFISGGLDFIKYAVALKTGSEVVTLPERFASRITNVASELGGGLGRGLEATAKLSKVAGPLLDGALTLVSIGLDITEIATAKTDAARGLAGLQLTLDVGLGALSATGIVLGLAGAATASSFVGAIAVPVAGVVIGVSALAAQYAQNDAIFDASMAFFQQVYEDLILHGAFDATTGTLNLSDKQMRNLRGMLVTEEDKNGENVVRRTPRLAPIRTLNLRDGSITYGSIRVPQIYGGWGTPPVYWFQGPSTANPDRMLNLLGRSHVQEQLRRSLELPEAGKLKSVVLPYRADWGVNGTNCWQMINAPGAVTWYLRNGGNGGFYMLDNARKGHQDVAPAVINIISVYYQELGMSLKFGNSAGFESINFVGINENATDVTVITPDNDLTLVSINPDTSYTIQGTGKNRFVVSLPDKGKAQIQTSGQDKWVIVSSSVTGEPVVGRASNGLPMLTIGNQVKVSFQGFNNNRTWVEIINPDNEERFYEYNPVTDRVGLVYNTHPDLRATDHTSRHNLQEEYKHPYPNALNRIQRFHKINATDAQGIYTNWIDFATGEDGGTNLHIPRYYDGGVAHSKQILKPGLHAEIYSFRGDGLNAGNLDSYLVQNNRVGSFIATTLNYSRSFTLAGFLGSHYSQLRTSQQMVPFDHVLIRFTGYVSLSKGQHTFYVECDDGHILYVDDQSIQQTRGSDRVYNLGLFEAKASGLYSFDLRYWQYRETGHLGVVLDSSVNLGSDYGQIFSEQGIFARENLPALPLDTRPVAGSPRDGYISYSNQTKEIFYRQPVHIGETPADAHIIKLPHQFIATNFNSSTLSLNTPLLATSSGQVQYHIFVNVTNSSDSTPIVPQVTPQFMLWNLTSQDYPVSVNEIRDYAHIRPGLVHSAILLESDASGAPNVCTYGFFDPVGHGGQGRLGILRPNNRGQIELKHTFVGSASYNQSRFLSENDCQPVNHTQLALGYEPVHGAHHGNTDYYLIHHKEQQKLYLAITGINNSGQAQTSEVVPLDLVLSDDHLNITYSEVSGSRDGIRVVASNGMILDIGDGSLVNATFVDAPNPCVFLHRAEDFEYQIVGFDRGEHRSWHLDANAMATHINDTLERFPTGVLSRTADVLPIVQWLPHNQIPILKANSSALREQQQAFDRAPCPVRENACYIRSLNRVFSYDRNLTNMGYDSPSQSLLVHNAMNHVYLIPHWSHDSNHTELHCPRPERFNPGQPDFASVVLHSGVVYGFGKDGQVYQLNRHGQTLVGLSFNKYPVPGLMTNVSGLNRARVVARPVHEGDQIRYKRDAPTVMMEGLSFRETAWTWFGEQVAPLVNEAKTLPNTSVASQLYLLPPENLTEIQAWYRTNESMTASEGVYVYIGKEPVSFLGSTLAWVNDLFQPVSNWFFAKDSGRLYQQVNGSQALAGQYVEVRPLGNDSSLLMTGGNNNSHFDSIRLGRPGPENILYMEGREGSNRYRITPEALRHYAISVVDNSGLPGVDNFTDATATQGTLNIEALSSEFSAGLGQNHSIWLHHYPSNHYVLLERAYYSGQPLLSNSSLPANESVAVNGSSASASAAREGWHTNPLDIVFTGYQTSAARLLNGLLGRTSPLSVPVSMEQLSGEHNLTLAADRQIKIDAGGFRVHASQIDEGHWLITGGKNDTQVTFNIRHYSYADETAGGLWVSSDASEGSYAQLRLNNRVNPAAGLNIWPTLNKKHQPVRDVTATTITARGHGWTVLSDHIQAANLSQPILAHLERQRPVTLLSTLHQVDTDPVYGYQELDLPGLMIGEDALGCFMINRPGDTLFVLLDQYAYSEFDIEMDESEFRVVLNQGATRECLLGLNDLPQGLLFAYDRSLGGWPLADGHHFLLAHGRSWQAGPHWLLPEVNPFLQADGRQATAAGHPVLYNLRPALLNTTYSGQSQSWTLDYAGIQVGTVSAATNTHYLSLTIGYRNPDGITIGSEHFLALPYTFSQWTFRSTSSPEIPFEIITTDPEQVSVQLPAYPGKGFVLEQNAALWMYSFSLGQYSGVYFSDGLKWSSELRQWLAGQPMTLVNPVAEPLSRGLIEKWRGTGNVLNNIVPVQLDTVGRYDINTGAGDDLILVKGGLWSARVKMPVSWRMPVDHKTENVVYNGRGVTLIHQNLTATPKPLAYKSYQLNVDPGPGNDILDLTGAVQATVSASAGQDTVILSHFSFADLSAVRNNTLFLEDIYSSEVEVKAGIDDFYRIESKRFSPSRNITELSSDSLEAIYFADGKQVTDVRSWLEGEVVPEDNTQYGNGTVAETEAVLEDAYAYALISRDEPVAEGNTALTRLDDTLSRLIQEMSSFQAQQQSGVSPSLTTAMSTPTPILASPTHTPSVSPTPTPLAMS